jgi:hypothetical protein
VSRGVCETDAAGCLCAVTERTRIGRRPEGGLGFAEADGRWQSLRGDETVSMNMWGFTPALFPWLEERFTAFLARAGDDPRAEFYIPSVVDDLIRAGLCRVRVLPSAAEWFGITYPEDRPAVQARIAEAFRAGRYPAPLWGDGRGSAAVPPG